MWDVGCEMQISGQLAEQDQLLNIIQKYVLLLRNVMKPFSGSNC